MTDPNAFLMGGSIPSCSFLEKGAFHEGEILDFKIRQDTDPKTREPKYWKNGDPVNVLVITLQTEENDPDIEDDDGKRNLWVRFKMRDAVSKAVRDAGEKGIEKGGWLGVEFVSQDRPKQKGLSGIKHFTATYEPPDPAAAAQEFLEGNDPDEGDDGNAQASEPEPPARGRGRGARGNATATGGSSRSRGREPAAAGASRGRGRGRGSGRYTEDEPPF